MNSVVAKLPLVTFAGILIFLQFTFVQPSRADFLDRFTWDFPGAESVWRPPGTLIFPMSGIEDSISISWADRTLARYKIDEELRTLATLDGPGFTFSHRDPRLYFITGYITQDAEFTVNPNSHRYENHLTGDRSILRLEGGYNFVLNSDESLTLAIQNTNLDFVTEGILQSLVHGIPELDTGDSSAFDWTESGWTLAAHYVWEQASFGVAYGRCSSEIGVRLLSENENISINVAPAGVTYGLTTAFPLGDDKNTEIFYRYTRNTGDGSVFRGCSQLGPFNALTNTREYGFQLRDSNEPVRWKFTLSRGIYSTTLHGSANISGFSAPVFGIASPRVHLDSDTMLSITTAQYEKDIGTILDSNSTFSIGLSRWDLEGGAKTWESYVFGSAIVNEKYTRLEWDSGWLVHIGLEFNWEIDSDDNLALFVGQTIPVSIVETDPDIWLESPDVPRVRRYDGGRLVSLTYTINF